MSAPCDEQNSYNEDSGHGDDSFMLRSHYQGSPHFDLVDCCCSGYGTRRNSALLCTESATIPLQKKRKGFKTFSEDYETS